MRTDKSLNHGSREFICDNSNKEYRWSIAKRNKSVVNLCSSLLVFGMAVFMTAKSMAAPTGGTITNGSGTIATQDNNTHITQDTQRLDINWQTFSTGTNESVNFSQPNADAVAINRVIGGVPSELRGALNANGRVFILNNAGITFYGTSQVNVGSLLATTAMDVKADGDVYSIQGKGEGQVVNQGNINVSNGGFAVLASPSVENSGYIKADLGQVQLASTNNVTVDLRGDNLITYGVSNENLQKIGVVNTGTLQAQSGQVMMTTKLASDIANAVVNLSGVVDADALDADHNGGTVVVASVGDINLNQVNVHADGGVSGNGGQITTIANHMNHFSQNAVLSAKGGSTAGNGGTIEVSGNNVKLNGTFHAEAPHGVGGKIILDPTTMTIKNGSGIAGTNDIYENTIETLSQAGTAVDIQATNLVTMQNLADNVLHGGSGNITLEATGASGRVEFQDVNDKIQTSTGNINIYAGSGGVGIGSLQTGGTPVINPGDITITTTGGGNISIKNVTIDNNSTAYGALADGILTIRSSGAATVNGNININLDLNSEAGNFDVLSKADIEAHNGVTINGYTTITAYGEGNGEGQQASAKSIVLIDSGANGGLGSVDITGNVVVTSDLTLASGAASYETVEGVVYPVNTVLASADIMSAGNISVEGNTTVHASGDVGGTNPYKLDVDALLTMDTNTESVSGSHSIDISGYMDVEASAYMDGYDAQYASANAAINLDATKDVTVDGNTTVKATASNDASDSAYKENATAFFNINAGNAGVEESEIPGSIDVTGNIDVSAHALSGSSSETSVNQTWYGYAEANIDFDATQDVNVTGNVTIDANALMYAQSTAYNGHADAQFSVEAGYSSEYGNIPGAISINGDVDVEANVDMGADSGDDAQAYANAYVSYDSYDGDINVEGNTSISADVTMDFNSYASDGTADAGFDLYANNGDAGGSIFITGDTDVSANIVIDGAVSDAEASAYIDADATNDVTINGDLTAIASAENVGSEGVYGSAGDTKAESSIDIEAGRFGGEFGSVLINGETIATANAKGEGDYAGGVDATASVDVHAINDVTINGDVTANAYGSNVAWDANGGDVEADAYLNVTAGYVDGSSSQNGSIEMHGNINLHAETYASNYTAADYNDASASADLRATNTILLDGDATIHAVSDVYASYDADSGKAYAALKLRSGYEFESGYHSGSIHVMGNVDVNADQRLDAYGLDEAEGMATAEVDYVANDGSITIDGSTTITANEYMPGSDNESYGASDGVAKATFNAETTGKFGHDINLNGDITALATTYITSGNSDASASASINFDAAGDLTINGKLSATATASNYANNGLTQVNSYLISNSDINTYANAKINLDANGDVVVSEDMSASAYAYLDGYEVGDADADAEIQIDAYGKVTVDGAVNVEASAENDGYYAGTAEATAAFGIETYDDIEVNGNVDAYASAYGTNGYSISDVEASASVDYNGGGTVAINGETNLSAYANIDVNQLDFASANAQFYAVAGNEGNADAQTIINRDLNIHSEIDATVSSGYMAGELQASSLGYVAATGTVSLDGNSNINSDVTLNDSNEEEKLGNEKNLIVSGSTDVSALSQLFVQGGNDGAGELNASGSVNVDANVNVDGVPGDQLAVAVALMAAGGNTYLANDFNVSATTTTSNDAYGESLAVALFGGGAGIVLNSKIPFFIADVVNNDAENVNADYFDVDVDLSALSGLGYLSDAAELMLNGNLEVKSNSIKMGYDTFTESGVEHHGSGDAIAVAGGILYATDDVVLLNGNAIVTADATSIGSAGEFACEGGCGSSSFAAAALVLAAGNFDEENEGENAVIAGDIISRANTHGNYGESFDLTGVFAENDIYLFVVDQDPEAQANDSLVKQTVTGFDSGYSGESILIIQPGNELVVMDSDSVRNLLQEGDNNAKELDVTDAVVLGITPEDFCEDVNCEAK
ncbi:MAG: filamentous hemagglutinin N-terminal domain-containing protein [Alphaproteobacteria bacterium]|nr:filamentous hemagglutinin N-terminal domain-containing protein [Alphaproteobacteria bacterium]